MAEGGVQATRRQPTVSPLVYATKGKSSPSTPNMGFFAVKGRSSFSPFGEDSPETASNLRTFRMLFHDEDTEMTQKLDFHGFDKHDDIVKNCKLIRKLITKEIQQMEKLILKTPTSDDESLTKDQIDSLSSVMSDTHAERSEVLKDIEEVIPKNISKVTEEIKSSDSRTQPSSPRLDKIIDVKPVIVSPNASDFVTPTSEGVQRRRGRPAKKKRSAADEVPAADPHENKSSLDDLKQESSENFVGLFGESPLRLSCQLKVKQITNELEEEDDFLGFPVSDPLRQSCIMKLEKIRAELDSTMKFSGFKSNDPLRLSALSKFKKVGDELKELIYAIKKKRALSIKAKVVLERLPDIKVDGSSTLPDTTPVVPPESKQSGVRTLKRACGDSEVQITKVLKPLSLTVGPPAKKQVKVLHPGSSLKRVREGPRIKSVRFCGGPGQRLPVSKFQPHEYPWNQEYSDPDDDKNYLSLFGDGTHRVHSTVAKDLVEGDGEKMLLGRQREILKTCLVKAAPPFLAEHIAELGFPVIAVEPFPPKPLCFLCGSAGIRQLIFCTVCCEPYHPFCVADDDLAASFVKLVFPSKLKKDGITEISEKCDTLVPSADGLSEEDVQRLEETFRSWTCYRCILCSVCGRNKRDVGKVKEKTAGPGGSRFVLCDCCRAAFHTECLGKRYDDGLVENLKPESESSVDSQQWLCESCAKCRSCGVKLEGTQERKNSRKKNSFMLCRECFRRRQKGSYCPVCNVCYDDDDYETRMMECGECKKWIHAKCEGVSEEQYQILSSLPENIEFICRLCDNTGNPLWLQAVRMEIITGCGTILRKFQRSTLTETRKRRRLTFDVAECNEALEDKKPKPSDPILCQSTQKILTISESTNLSQSAPTGRTPEEPSSQLKTATTSTLRSKRKSKENASNSGKSGLPQIPRRKTRMALKRSHSPQETYQMADGSIVCIRECHVRLSDIVKFPTLEASRYLQISKDNHEADVVVENIPREHNPTEISDAHDVPMEMTAVYSANLETVSNNENEKTPKKNREEHPICLTPRILYTPSKKVGDFVELVQKELNGGSIQSVMHFRDLTLNTFEDSFGDLGADKLGTLCKKFQGAVKEVFPWFDEDLINNSNLPKYQPRVPSGEDASVVLVSTDPFEDTFWCADSEDLRKCAFCGNLGDMPPDGPGRLIWAGLSEWIHVNCALWSSEVWEEESGALQQVGQALTRSKNLNCSFCARKGASVSCCHSSCQKSYHFSCAVKAGCGLKLDKNVFCDDHAIHIEPSLLQREFPVQRKVFVDFEYIKKKERPVSSDDIRIFIGSMKIEALGHILPISVCSLPSGRTDDSVNTALVPNNYECTRLFWSYSDPSKKLPYTISASVPKDTFWDFAHYQFSGTDEFHLVVDHSDPEEIVQEKIAQINSFHNWLESAPKLIDEYDEEWIPTFPANCYCEHDWEHCEPRWTCEDEQDLGPLEPSLSLNDYVTLYERMCHLNALLQKDEKTFVGFEKQQDGKADPGKMKFNSFVCFEECIKASNAFKEEGFRRRLFGSMLDGAVNDSSSEASFSSGSSTSSSVSSADDSDDEEHTATTETSSSSSSSEETDNETARRVTRNRTPRGGKSAPDPPPTCDRRLRNRQKKPEVKCPDCSRTFESQGSLAKHGRWCKSSKSPQKRKVSLPVKEDPPLTPERRKRGRPRKSDAVGDATKVQPSSSSPSNSTTVNTEKPSGTKVNDSLKSPPPQGVDDVSPKTCQNCSNTYRTLASFNKHLVTCTPYSTSEEDCSDSIVEADATTTSGDPTTYENSEESTIPVRQQGNVPVVGTKSVPVHEMTDSGSSSEDESTEEEVESMKPHYGEVVDESTSISEESAENTEDIEGVRNQVSEEKLKEVGDQSKSCLEQGNLELEIQSNSDENPQDENPEAIGTDDDDDYSNESHKIAHVPSDGTSMEEEPSLNVPLDSHIFEGEPQNITSCSALSEESITTESQGYTIQADGSYHLQHAAGSEPQAVDSEGEPIFVRLPSEVQAVETPETVAVTSRMEFPSMTTTPGCVPQKSIRDDYNVVSGETLAAQFKPEVEAEQPYLPLGYSVMTSAGSVEPSFDPNNGLADQVQFGPKPPSYHVTKLGPVPLPDLSTQSNAHLTPHIPQHANPPYTSPSSRAQLFHQHSTPVCLHPPKFQAEGLYQQPSQQMDQLQLVSGPLHEHSHIPPYLTLNQQLPLQQNQMSMNQQLSLHHGQMPLNPQLPVQQSQMSLNQQISLQQSQMSLNQPVSPHPTQLTNNVPGHHQPSDHTQFQHGQASVMHATNHQHPFLCNPMSQQPAYQSTSVTLEQQQPSQLQPTMYPGHSQQLPPQLFHQQPNQAPSGTIPHQLSHLQSSGVPHHVCPFHVGPNNFNIAGNSVPQPHAISTSTFNSTQNTNNLGVTYILVRQGDTISSIPVNQFQSDETLQALGIQEKPGGHFCDPQKILSESVTPQVTNVFDSTSLVSPGTFQATYVPASTTPGGPTCTGHVCCGPDGTIMPNCSCLPSTPLRAELPKMAPLPAPVETQGHSFGGEQMVRRNLTQIRLAKSPMAPLQSKAATGQVKKNPLIQPKIVPAPASPAKVGPVDASVVPSQQDSPVTPSKVPISSPNIAVVRPMENPLQKMTNQVARIEINFNNPVEAGSGVPAFQTPVANPSTGTPLELDGGSGGMERSQSVGSSPGPAALRQLYPRSSAGTVGEGSPVKPACDVQKPAEQDTTIDSNRKSIKVTLKRKEGGDSYSINDIKESGLESTGAMRSLKIKARITSGEQAGTSTDVVVVPVIQTIPIVKGAAGQNTTITYDEKQGLVYNVPGSSAEDPSKGVKLPVNAPGDTKPSARLTHRAVIVYEVKCNDAVLFRSSDVRAVWSHIFETVQGTRLKYKLPPLAYPVTNISLPENHREAAASFNMLGLTHQAVQFLLEQLPGTNSVMEKHRFRFHEPNSEDALPPVNPTGCARTERFTSRKPFDMFGWLASKIRGTPTIVETLDDGTRQALPLAMRYRNLREKSSNTLGVYYSAIHGRGLFTRREIQEGEMIIEYAGELIRSILSDHREKYYESKGIGCYFFKIDENVIIDATKKGNAARFINHSCDPNCRSKAVDILGKKHILIFAERKIRAGEELTYDYKFAVEDYDKKIPCTCGAKKCRKYLN